MDITVNHKYFVVKLFLDSLGCAKIKCTKIHAQYCSTGSFVRKLFNMKNYCMKYFRHEIFAIYSILCVCVCVCVRVLMTYVPVLVFICWSSRNES